MAASNKTINQVCGVLIKHMDGAGRSIALLDDLCQVEGNKSFVETVKAVREKLKVIHNAATNLGYLSKRK